MFPWSSNCSHGRFTSALHLSQHTPVLGPLHLLKLLALSYHPFLNPNVILQEEEHRLKHNLHFSVSFRDNLQTLYKTPR